MTPRLHPLARRIRTTTAAGLVPLLLLASVPACATRSSRPAVPTVSQPTARPLSEWSRVEAVPVGTPILVQLYDDEAPPDRRRVTGRFHAATAGYPHVGVGRRVHAHPGTVGRAQRAHPSPD